MQFVDSLDQLPLELLTSIGENLPDEDLLAWRITSSRLQPIAENILTRRVTDYPCQQVSDERFVATIRMDWLNNVPSPLYRPEIHKALRQPALCQLASRPLSPFFDTTYKYWVSCRFLQTTVKYGRTHSGTLNPMQAAAIDGASVIPDPMADLLKLGANPNQMISSSGSHSILLGQLAAASKRRVNLLLDAGASCTWGGHFWKNPEWLKMAIVGRHWSIVADFAKARVDWTSQSSNMVAGKRTPAHLLVETAAPEVLAVLLELDPSLARVSTRDFRNRTPLDWAEHLGKTEIADLLKSWQERS